MATFRTLREHVGTQNRIHPVFCLAVNTLGQMHASISAAIKGVIARVDCWRPLYNSSCFQSSPSYVLWFLPTSSANKLR
eukprot:1406905-Amphidinium_carterae.1